MLNFLLYATALKRTHGCPVKRLNVRAIDNDVASTCIHTDGFNTEDQEQIARFRLQLPRDLRITNGHDFEDSKETSERKGFRA